MPTPCPFCSDRQASFSDGGADQANSGRTVCFACFRADRDRRRSGNLGTSVPAPSYLAAGSGAADAVPSGPRHPDVQPALGDIRPRALNARQIDHRRAMLAHLAQRRRMG